MSKVGALRGELCPGRSPDHRSRLSPVKPWRADRRGWSARLEQEGDSLTPRCELSAARSFEVVGAGYWAVVVGGSRSKAMRLLYSAAVRLQAWPEVWRGLNFRFRISCMPYMARLSDAVSDLAFASRQGSTSMRWWPWLLASVSGVNERKYGAAMSSMGHGAVRTAPKSPGWRSRVPGLARTIQSSPSSGQGLGKAWARLALESWRRLKYSAKDRLGLLFSTGIWRGLMSRRSSIRLRRHQISANGGCRCRHDSSNSCYPPCCAWIV